MKKLMKKALGAVLLVFCVNTVSAENYPNIVTLESINERVATFTTLGVADKKNDVDVNAVKSLFNTLFYIGVDGVNDGKPLITNDDERLISVFMANKVMMYGSNRNYIKDPVKNRSKKFEAYVKVTVPIQNLLKELAQNGLYVDKQTDSDVIDGVGGMSGVGLPTIIVVPYKKDGESYDSILQNDYDRRVAVAKMQSGFESRNITTIDLTARIAAMKRRMEYESTTADSNDKQLLLSSGADVYVTVDLVKDIQSSGSRVSLVVKAYETSTGSVLASNDGFTRRFNTSAVDQLCSYAVEDCMPDFLDGISKNFAKQVSGSKRVVLQVSIAGSSMMTMDDTVGPNNYSVSNVIRQWVRSNSDMGKYHLQGVVPESMIFDYVMIPAKDSDGLMMDAAQFGFLLQSYLTEQQGVRCSSKIDGNTIYITIE